MILFRLTFYRLPELLGYRSSFTIGSHNFCLLPSTAAFPFFPESARFFHESAVIGVAAHTRFTSFLRDVYSFPLSPAGRAPSFSRLLPQALTLYLLVSEGKTWWLKSRKARVI